MPLMPHHWSDAWSRSVRVRASTRVIRVRLHKKGHYCWACKHCKHCKHCRLCLKFVGKYHVERLDTSQPINVFHSKLQSVVEKRGELWGVVWLWSEDDGTSAVAALRMMTVFSRRGYECSCLVISKEGYDCVHFGVSTWKGPLHIFFLLGAILL